MKQQYFQKDLKYSSPTRWHLDQHALTVIKEMQHEKMVKKGQMQMQLKNSPSLTSLLQSLDAIQIVLVVCWVVVRCHNVLVTCAHCSMILRSVNSML